MPPITFDAIPSGTLTPAVFVEFNGSQAQQAPAQQPFRRLVIGQRRSTGAVAELVPTRCTREDQVAAAFGRASMIHSMAKALFANDPATETWFLGLDDPSGGTAATYTVTFTASSPKAGTIAVYVAGRRYAVACATTSTATTLATALVAAIGADPDAEVTASSSAGVVTLTARHTGASAGTIDVRHSHHADEALPLGITVAVAAGVAGAGSLDLSAAITSIGDQRYNLIVSPFWDTNALGDLHTELASRWGPTRQIDGVAFQATPQALNDAATTGSNPNSPHLVVLSSYKSPTPPWSFAAGVAGAITRPAIADPARPFQRLEVAGVVAPRASEEFTRVERNVLLVAGVATTAVGPGRRVQVERLVTTYRTNSQGASDTAYRDLNTVLTLSLMRYELVAEFTTRYPRHKLAGDGNRFGPGQAVMTPSLAIAEMLRIFRSWEERGLVEDVDQFKADLIAEIDQQDPARLALYLPPNLVNQLRTVAAQIAFRL